MYDYATQAKQTQILTQIGEVNNNIEELTITIKEQAIMIGLLMSIIIIEKLVKVLTGGKW